MRFRNGLAVFQKTSSEWMWNIASFHSPHSLTWRWSLSVAIGGWETRRFWPMVMWHGQNGYVTRLLRIPFVAMFRMSTQPPMWYRDLYMRRRDEADRLRSERDALERTIRPYAGPGLKVVTSDPENAS